MRATDPVRGGPPAPDAPTDKLLDTIHSELALGFDFLKLDVGAMETEALAEHVATRVRALLAAGTPQPTATDAVSAAAVRAACLLRSLWLYAEEEAGWLAPDVLATLKATVAEIDLALRAVVPPPPDTAAAPTTARDGFWTLNCEGDSEGGRYHLRGDFGRDRDGAWAAYERLLRAPAPATDDAPTEPKVDEGRVWSLIRDVLTQGMAIQQDDATGSYPSYEALSRRLDAAARERVSDFTALLRGASPRATAPATTGGTTDAE